MFESEEAAEFIQMFLELSDNDKAKLIENPLSFKDHEIMKKYVNMVKAVHNAMGKYSKEEIIKELDKRGFGKYSAQLVNTILERSD